MTALYPLLHSDALTVALYTAFAAYCLAEVAALLRRGVPVAPRVAWVLCLAAVFHLCADTGYLADWLAWPHRMEARFHAALNVATLALLAYSLAARPLRRIGEDARRADVAEADLTVRQRLVSASFAHIHSAIYQVCQFVPDPAGPLVGPYGTRYDLRIVAATPGMRRYFHVREGAAVEGRSHYEVYPGIYDPTTGERGRGDWLAHHARALANEAVVSAPEGDGFDGPEGYRTFRWALHPLCPTDGGTRAEGLLMEVSDRTEVEEAERAREEAEREVEDIRHALLSQAAPGRPSDGR